MKLLKSIGNAFCFFIGLICALYLSLMNLIYRTTGLLAPSLKAYRRRRIQAELDQKREQRAKESHT